MKDQLDPQAVASTGASLVQSVGTILQVRDDSSGGEAAYRLVIDFGARLGVRTSRAPIARHYSKQELVGRRVAVELSDAARSELSFTGLCDETGSGLAAAAEEHVPAG